MFYYFSKNIFTHVSYLQNFCGIGAVLSLWAHHTLTQHSAHPQDHSGQQSELFLADSWKVLGLPKDNSSLRLL